MSRNSKTQESNQQTTETPPRESILETDLSQLTLSELLALKQKVDDLVLQSPVRLQDDDLRLEYSVSLLDKTGLKYRNEGAVTMGSIMHSRSLSKAPRRFENTFQDQVYVPVWNAAFDLIAEKNDTENDLNTVQRIGNEQYAATPGLPPGGIIPGM